MNDNIDKKIYLLCDDTEEHYALTHKEELKKLEENLGTFSEEHIKKIKEQYNL